MKNRYDIAIIGAGPIGSYTAYQLSSRGFSVCLFDAKPQIGKDVICTGLISKAAFQRYDLPAWSILSRIDSFTFVSPLGQRLEYHHPDVFAYVVSREFFDQALLGLAKKSGAAVFLDEVVTRVRENKHGCTCHGRRRAVNSRFLVLATGNSPRLHGQAGLGRPAGYLKGAQVELAGSKPGSEIEIHLGQGFAPGSFGWIVPAGERRRRVGVILDKDARANLRRMLEDRLGLDQIKDSIRQKAIVFGPVQKSAGKRILAVGEAAGQVKTTTGGGIFYGLLGSEICVDKLTRALKKQDGLAGYELAWRSALVSELEIGLQLRRVARRLDDETIERLFRFVKNNRLWVELLKPRIDFDFHSNLIYFCMKGFQTLLLKK